MDRVVRHLVVKSHEERRNPDSDMRRRSSYSIPVVKLLAVDIYVDITL